jgi:hypothetical protein
MATPKNTTTETMQRPAKAVEVAPGIYALGPEEIGHTVLAKYVPTNQTGRYALRAVGDRWALVTSKLCDLLGLPGNSRLLYRLAEQGYIEVIPAGEKLRMLNLDSWAAHIEAVRRATSAGMDFWTESKKRRLGSVDKRSERLCQPAPKEEPCVPAAAAANVPAPTPAQDESAKLLQEFMDMAAEDDSEEEWTRLLKSARELLPREMVARLSTHIAGLRSARLAGRAS